MKPRALVVGVIASGLLLADGVRAADVAPGRAAYLKYCSACHGSDGKGDGVAAFTMRPRPADLTQLAAQHGGKFPYVKVKDVIDGRKQVTAHGESDMPVWGELFTEEKAAAQSDAQVRGKVQLITDYLSSIQAR